TDASSGRGLLAADAQGDPSVGGCAEVVERRSLIPDALAAGPADLLQAIGARLGKDHVRTANRQVPAEPLQARGPGVQGDHRRTGPHRSLRGLRDHGLAPCEPSYRASLMDTDAALHQDAPETSRQARRLDRRTVFLQTAAEECRGVADPVN